VRLSLALLSLFVTAPVVAQSSPKRLVVLDDVYQEHQITEPRCSPDGKWVTYTVETLDKDSDKKLTHIWMSDWATGNELQLTYGGESESAPAWSPDGKYLSFNSSRPGKEKGSQIWAMDRRGGEARQLTNLKKFSILSYDWAPDSKRLLLVLREKEEDEDEDDDEKKPSDKKAEKEKPPKPVVIDRYQFKEDIEGYLTAKRSHLYLFDIASKKLDELTKGDFDDTDALFSPDGSSIGFVSNRDPDPDRTKNTDIFVMESRVGATQRKLTNFNGPDAGRLSWSPDGKTIAYLEGSEPKYSGYNLDKLALVPASGGPPRVLTAELDRGVALPVFSSDGRSLFFIVADDRSEYPARVSVNGGAIERLAGTPMVATGIDTHSAHTAFVASRDDAGEELYALDNGNPRKLSHQHEAWVSQLKLGAVEDISFRAKDGNEVHGLVTKPPFYEAGKKYPTLLRIHGGPNWQSGHDFNLERQLLAANGYVVLSVNYRGSYGRGAKYGEAIWGDWGNKEVIDLLAAVDHVVKIGLADPGRLGVGGWSYGGILTDYLIASDGRFKAAVSGAGSANQISMYGVDEYIFQYDTEVGPPWKNPDAWLKLSYPFFKADHIHTPTLFMGGEEDANVPLVGGEQMYQALKTLGVPTQLVVYPGEFHEFTRPSFIRDRFERYLAWYGKYLKPEEHAK
jgi:dipeptidyl aminopeptidase/acylaminoacyl peptidase